MTVISLSTTVSLTVTASPHMIRCICRFRRLLRKLEDRLRQQNLIGVAKQSHGSEFPKTLIHKQQETGQNISSHGANVVV
ncbi:hypothetical protein BDZ89DRAFT_252391 [Hymenopellis radicata]|nr:hypothetical protein BDZ89DRAFT_252391 [Hymenopellis radicata]